ncbi:hypothetical protein ACVWY5_005711 [Bradyrhizobium sp. USDA 3256]
MDIGDTCKVMFVMGLVVMIEDLSAFRLVSTARRLKELDVVAARIADMRYPTMRTHVANGTDGFATRGLRACDRRFQVIDLEYRNGAP